LTSDRILKELIVELIEDKKLESLVEKTSSKTKLEIEIPVSMAPSSSNKKNSK